MTADVTIRRGTAADARALRRFRCARGAWYQREVDRYIRRGLSRTVGRTAAVWIAERNGTVVAVAAHEPRSAPGDAGGGTISYLSAFAASEDATGAFRTGAILSELLKRLMEDVKTTGRLPYLYTLVASDNDKVRAFCERVGFVGAPVPSKPGYRFYAVHLAERPAARGT